MSELDAYTTVANMQYILYHQAHDLSKVAQLYTEDAHLTLQMGCWGDLANRPALELDGRANIDNYLHNTWQGGVDPESAIIHEMNFKRDGPLSYSTHCEVSQRRRNPDGEFRWNRLTKEDTFKLRVVGDGCKISEHKCVVVSCVPEAQE